MKRAVTLSPFGAGLVVAAVLAAACKSSTPDGRVSETAATAAAPRPAIAPLPPGAVRHVVVFKYKPTATEAQIAELTRAFGALKDQVPGILAFEHGLNHSPGT